MRNWLARLLFRSEEEYKVARLKSLLYEGNDFDDRILLQNPNQVASLFKEYPYILGYFFSEEEISEIIENLSRLSGMGLEVYEEWKQLSEKWRDMAYAKYFLFQEDIEHGALTECQNNLFRVLFTNALFRAINNGYVTLDEATRPAIFEQARSLLDQA